MSESPVVNKVAYSRYDLLTPINHILGYIEILIEDADDVDLQEFIPDLVELHHGGRSLLKSIQKTWTETAGVVSGFQLHELETRIVPLTTGLLQTSRNLAAKLEESGREQALADLGPVSVALSRLLSVVRQFTCRAEPESADSMADRVKAAVQKPSNSRRRSARGRLLIAEADAENRNLLRRRLELEGHQVWEAENGIQALDLIQHFEYDLVLLDIMLPLMNGLDVLEALRPRLRELPVIMISALDETNSVARCIEMGAEDYLSKPFDRVLLRARVGASLEKKWLRDQARRKTMELSQANECLKQTQEQLVAQEKMASLGIFSAGVAHEVKGALTFVVNSSERALLTLGGMRQVLESIHPNFTLEQGEYLDAFLSDLSKHLEQTQKAGRRAEGIVRGTLAGWTKSTELQEDVDLNVLIGEAVNLAYLLGARSMSTFSTSIEGLYDPACPTISCVPGEISRACLNIAQNSFYALHQKRLLLGDSFRPVLRVASRLAGSEVEVRIRDNGIGIAPEILQRIFDPFFTTKTKGSQNGLGLSLSHQIIVEQHNGTIRAESEEGEWTEVVITLPK